MKNYHNSFLLILTPVISNPVSGQNEKVNFKGAWRSENGVIIFSGSKRDGEIQARDTDQPRKTMKILSGTRFQWIA